MTPSVAKKSAKNAAPRAPADLGPTGRAFWRKITAEFLLEAQHETLLHAACAQLDREQQARAVVKKAGPVIADRFGVLKENPAAAIERSASITAMRLLRELNLDLPADESRAPRRNSGRR